MTLAALIDEARQLPFSERQVLLDALSKSLNNTSSETLEEDDISPEEQAELAAMYRFSDDLLWILAAEQMPQNLQDRMQLLMDSNTFGTISEAEYQELAAYVARGNRLMLRKGQAAAILTERGHQVTKAHLKLYCA